MASNPRRSNGHLRDKVRARLLATEEHCHLCGGIIDKDLPAGHPMAPEVDEIIPVSKGGSPYDMANLKLAHRICNQRRGNKDLNQVRETLNQALPKSRDWSKPE